MKQVQQVANFAEAFLIVNGRYPTMADFTGLTGEKMWEIIDQAIAEATPEQIELLDIRYN